MLCKALNRWFFVAALVFSFGCSVAQAQIGPKPNQIGNVTLRVLQNGTNPKAQPKFVPFVGLKGKPVAILYWKINDTKAETELKIFEKIAGMKAYAGKIHFFSAVKAANAKDEKAAVARIRQLKLKIPTILDRNQIAPYLEAWWAFPRYGLIDKKGFVRIWNCASSVEVIGPKMTFLAGLNLAAAGKPIPTLRGTTKLTNSHQLVGKKFPDVGLNNAKLKPTTLSKLIKGKTTLLAFWSVTCPHCRQVIPAVAKYWKARQANGVYMLTITRAPSQELRDMITKLHKTSKVSWHTAYAPENATLSYFNIVKVPTVFLIDKKGIIRYVWIQPDANWIQRALETALFKFKLF